VELLLDKLARQPETAGPSPEQLRVLRSLEVLERLATPEAHQLLQALVRRTPDGWLVQEARAAAGRMARRPAGGP
jgi:hypothetical protein